MEINSEKNHEFSQNLQKIDVIMTSLMMSLNHVPFRRFFKKLRSPEKFSLVLFTKLRSLMGHLAVNKQKSGEFSTKLCLGLIDGVKFWIEYGK